MSSVITRIEKDFILSFLQKNKVKIEIKCEDDSTEAYILDLNSKEIKIELLYVFDSLKSYNAEIKVFFYFQNAYHTFNSNIIKIQNDIAIIKNPETLVKNLLRKHERIQIKDNLFVNFELPGEILPLNYPTCEKYYYPDKPPINADFSDVKIDSILNKFKEKMNSIISNNKIIMLRNYNPKNFYEELVLKTGKIVYIPNTHSDLPSKQISDEFEILVKNDWFNYEKEKNNTNLTLLNKTISDYLLHLSKNDIFSYVIVPVLYRNYIVALIYLINNHSKNIPIDTKLISYTNQFAKIVSYTLKKSGYFKSEEGETIKYSFPIYDMSPGGLACLINDQSIEDKIKLNDNARCTIEIQNRKIFLLVKFIRKFQKLSKSYFGLLFIEIKKDDYDFLCEYLNQQKHK